VSSLQFKNRADDMKVQGHLLITCEKNRSCRRHEQRKIAELDQETPYTLKLISSQFVQTLKNANTKKQNTVALDIANYEGTESVSNMI
jgi:hypothetical protein